MEFYNHRRYHKALKDITPADILASRRDEILDRRREVKEKNNRTTESIEPDSQGTTRNSLTSLLPKLSHFAEVQHRKRKRP